MLSRSVFRTLYSEQLLAVNYFCKTLHFRYLKGLWIHLCFLWQIQDFHIEPSKKGAQKNNTIVWRVSLGFFRWRVCISSIEEIFCLFVSLKVYYWMNSCNQIKCRNHVQFKVLLALLQLLMRPQLVDTLLIVRLRLNMSMCHAVIIKY